jgi:hypothetical protein
MKYDIRRAGGAGLLLLMVSALLLAKSNGALDAAHAREMLRHLGGGELPKAQVRIKSIQSGVTGSDAIVEAQIETAYRFARTDEGWKLAEVRLGDRQWESVELITEAVRREKIRRTTLIMQHLAAGLETLRRERGAYVVAEEIVKLLDQLPPQYASARDDLWGNPFIYRGTASGYQLISAGPDQQSGTGDDLIIENGALRPVAQ